MGSVEGRRQRRNTMDANQRSVMARAWSHCTKAELADWLIEHGTIYPNRRGLLQWSKDDLVNSAVDRAIEELEQLAELS